MKELTDAEIDKIFRETTNSIPGTQSMKFARALEAAAHAKQREPEVVKFRAARNPINGRVRLLAIGEESLHDWEWLDDNGKPQIYEVKLP